MKKEFFITSDGSTSIHIPEWNEQYHSKHGAIQEAYHVFIKAGLDNFKDKSSVSVLEIGFGTGLNAFITFLESKKRNLIVDYIGVEKFPITTKDASKLNYVKQLKATEFNEIFKQLHQIPWEEKIALTNNFTLTKRKQDFKEIKDTEIVNLIYFDAFGARVQPELWTETIFKKMYQALKKDGILVTYSAKGSVRRAMLSAGFKVEKIPGPKGKREMLRAIKN